ncbi:MAG TPA: ribosome small subunit-dependent GTPase A [Abditibacterium sp.]|jgi:ribosome biogenesis GTPase
MPEAIPTETELIEGTVMKSAGGVYEVDVPEEGKDRLPLVCQLGGRLKKGARKWSQPVSVGDRVRVRPLETSGQNARGQLWREGFIEELLPRTSQLGRSRYNKTAQVTVANLDQVVIVMASREPDLNPHRLDRFLVLAEANDLRPVIIFNKIDLLKKREIKTEIEPLEKLYSSLGYPVLLTSAEPEIDMGRDELKKQLKGHISAFIGSSGVGKSSLVMMIQPKLELWVGEVMEIGKGRHTTTDVTLHPLDGGGYIADTPGVKTVALLEQQEIVVAQCFPEIRALLGQCKFNDCSHRSEPGCVVQTALEDGKIAASRHESYVRLWQEIDAMAPVYAKKEGGRSSIFSDDI